MKFTDMQPMAGLPVDLLDRMERAVEKVQNRLRRAASALEADHVPYVVIGGNAVAVWVATQDETAVRHTQDVDLLIRQTDLDRAERVLATAGFIRHQATGMEAFLDGPDAKVLDAVHIIVAGQKVRPGHQSPAPDVEPYHFHPQFRLLPLKSLVEMKLNSFRRKDQVHLQDLVQTGLVDQSWTSLFSGVPATRLQEILDDPEG